jgi:hypothetical protein
VFIWARPQQSHTTLLHSPDGRGLFTATIYQQGHMAGYKQPTAGFDTNSKLEATPCPPDGPLAYVESEEPDFSTPGEERSKARWSVRGSRHGRENPSQASSDLITLPLSASMIPKSFPLLFFRVKKKRVYLPFDYVYCVCSTGFPICLLGIDPPVLLNAADGRGLR